jgi:hypothetical protein
LERTQDSLIWTGKGKINNGKMKYVIVFLLLSVTASFAQKTKVEYYIYNKDWKAAKEISTAEYVVQTTNIADTLFVNRLFLGRTTLWKQESFKDAEQTMPHGQFGWYDEAGRIDSSGYVYNKRKNGTWSYYNDTLGIYLSIKYDNGKEIERRDYVNRIIKTTTGDKSFAEEKREKDSAKTDNNFSKIDEREASFKGGTAGFKKYLERNIVPPTDLVKTGVVKLQFIINRSGKVENLLLLRSLQFSADIEALRVLSEMPDWTPAYQNGRNVLYQAIQYLTFQVR